MCGAARVPQRDPVAVAGVDPALGEVRGGVERFRHRACSGPVRVVPDSTASITSVNASRSSSVTVAVGRTHAAMNRACAAARTGPSFKGEQRMQTRGAILRQAPGKYEVADLEVDDPREGEVQVKLTASGLCHSDDHVATGDMPVGIYPIAGGHEGAGDHHQGRRRTTRGSRRATTSSSPSCPPAGTAAGAPRACRTSATWAPGCCRARAGRTRPTSGSSSPTAATRSARCAASRRSARPPRCPPTPR